MCNGISGCHCSGGIRFPVFLLTYSFILLLPSPLLSLSSLLLLFSNPLYALPQHVGRTLGCGNVKLAVQLPENEDLNEWIAINSECCEVCPDEYIKSWWCVISCVCWWCVYDCLATWYDGILNGALADTYDAVTSGVIALLSTLLRVLAGIQRAESVILRSPSLILYCTPPHTHPSLFHSPHIPSFLSTYTPIPFSC